MFTWRDWRQKITERTKKVSSPNEKRGRLTEGNEANEGESDGKGLSAAEPQPKATDAYRGILGIRGKQRAGYAQEIFTNLHDSWIEHYGVGAEASDFMRLVSRSGFSCVAAAWRRWI